MFRVGDVRVSGTLKRIDTLSRTQQIIKLMEVNERLEIIQGLPAIEDGMPLSELTRPAKDNYHFLRNPASSSDAAAALASTCGRARWLPESLPTAW